jgi:hypothetical protein
VRRDGRVVLQYVVLQYILSNIAHHPSYRRPLSLPTCGLKRCELQRCGLLRPALKARAHPPQRMSDWVVQVQQRHTPSGILRGGMYNASGELSSERK